MRVPYNYLPEQFPEDELLSNIKYEDANITTRIQWRIGGVAERGDFTLGTEVEEFEQAWAEVVGTQHAIGMSNGTDAIAVALESAGVEPGAEVITSPVSFIATSGAIIQAGGKPVFIDVKSYTDPNISPVNAPAAPTWAVPVLWAGSASSIADWGRSDKRVVLDAAQGINAEAEGEKLGSFDFYGMAYSLHPLKNVNVWGDGGVIATNDAAVDNIARYLRNHGLEGRDIWRMVGYNHRLSTVQAAVGLEVLPTWEEMDAGRQINANILTRGINEIDGIHAPHVDTFDRHGWHLYQVVLDRDEGFTARDRERLLYHLIGNEIEAKVHYPIPLHLQPALRGLNYGRGDFPEAESFCDLHVTLPIHEYLQVEQMEFIVETLSKWEALR